MTVVSTCMLNIVGGYVANSAALDAPILVLKKLMESMASS